MSAAMMETAARIVAAMISDVPVRRVLVVLNDAIDELLDGEEHTEGSEQAGDNENGGVFAPWPAEVNAGRQHEEDGCDQVAHWDGVGQVVRQHHTLFVDEPVNFLARS
jgi:hypothetical protein